MKKLLIALTLVLAIAFPAQAATITGRVNQRTGASTAYSIIQKIPAGANVGVVYRMGNWYKVSYNGRTGFIYRSYLQYGATRSTLTFNGAVIPFYNNFSYSYMTNNTYTSLSSVQRRLDQGYAVMTGGSFSSSDGWSNYISGHASGIFKPVTQIQPGHKLILRDKYNRATTYIVRQRIQSKNPSTTMIGKSYVYAYYANGVADEAILLQFCVGDDLAVVYATPN